MTNKGKDGYKDRYGTRDYQPLTTTELKEMIESLRRAPAGTTLIAIRLRSKVE